MQQCRAELEELRAIIKESGLMIERLPEELAALQQGRSELGQLRAILDKEQRPEEFSALQQGRAKLESSKCFARSET